MSAPDATPLSDALLDERAWVHALARRLVRDEADADDLEQETWRAALERPPPERRSVRGWLATVMYRLAGRARRAGARRDRRERAGARREAVPSTAALVAEAELHRRLVEAVLALNEPFRSTVLARYVHGLTPRELAARSGESVHTVASRLARGLASLRARLDADGHGDRRAWASVLTALDADVAPEGPLGSGASGGAAIAAAAGGLGMATSTKGIWVGAALLLVSVAGAAWFVVADGPERDGSGVRPAPRASAEADALAVTPARGPAGAPPPGPQAGAAGTLPTSGSKRAWRLAGAVVDDATGAPIGGATVHVGLERGVRREFLATAVTDAEGRFEVPLAALDGLGDVARRRALVVGDAAGPGGYAMRSERGAPAFAFRADAADGVLRASLRLRAGGVARGRVVDATGEPVVGASLVAQAGPAVSQAFSGDRGEFFVAIPGAGPGTLEVVAAGAGAVQMPVPAWEPGRDVDLGDVRLRGAATIAGRVVFADGSPAADVPLGGVRWAPRGRDDAPRFDGLEHAMGRSEADGRFRLTGLARGPFRLVAPGDGRSAASGTEVLTGDDAARLVIDGHLVRVSMLDPDGTPLLGEAFRVRWGEGPAGVDVAGNVGEVDVFVVPAGVTVTALAELRGFDPPLRPISASATADAARRETSLVLRVPTVARPGRLDVVVAGVPPRFPTYTLWVRSAAGDGDVLTWRELPLRSATFDLPSGAYRVSFLPDDDPRSGRVHPPFAADVEIRADEATTVTPHFPLGGRVRLHAVPPPATAVRPVGGDVVPPDGGIALPIPSWRAEDGTVVELRGRVEWGRPFAPSIALPVGRCVVRVVLSGGDRRTGIVEIREGETTDVDLVPAAR